MPLIKNRIRNFLNEIQYNKEFSTTIVKNYVSIYIYVCVYYVSIETRKKK